MPARCKKPTACAASPAAGNVTGQPVTRNKARAGKRTEPASANVLKPAAAAGPSSPPRNRPAPPPPPAAIPYGFLGVSMLVGLRLLGVWRGAILEPMCPALVGLLHRAFGPTVLAGAAPFLYDPLRDGLHGMSLPKPLLLAPGLLHAHGVRRLRTARGWRPLRRVAAGAALAVWLAVVGASTWITWGAR